MPRKIADRDIETLEDLRRTSGWYLAAWRQYRRLSLDDLAAEAGTTKSALSELENGVVRKNGTKPRWNRDTLAALVDALGITEGMMFDVNPYTANPEWMAQYDALRSQGDRKAVTALGLVDALPTRRKA
jgi:transcriptional regulator with XRE-family HTH domain